ncbi:hypothetical protein EDB84DRAFT_1565349 [Lactarius hengduanensis]|nr:hypothetical protein EDB84DRAFT_1565349 [Lactarius hengduanensis]
MPTPLADDWSRVTLFVLIKVCLVNANRIASSTVLHHQPPTFLSIILSFALSSYALRVLLVWVFSLAEPLLVPSLPLDLALGPGSKARSWSSPPPEETIRKFNACVQRISTTYPEPQKAADASLRIC